jgi:ABC-type phosphate/phosphonate transport system substrate-binding protein
MFASLPMFDLPELRERTDALWAAWSDALRSGGVAAPATLTRPDERLMTHWRTPELLASQTCGYPFTLGLSPKLGLIGTFAYQLDEEPEPGIYRSVLVRRTDDRRSSLPEFHGAHVAVNSEDSLSGCVSLGVALTSAGVDQVGNVILTGSHANSLATLQNGQADLASIDAITFALLQDVRPQAVQGIAVVQRGPRIPCTPLISAYLENIAQIREALCAALLHLPETTLRALRIIGFAATSEADYATTVELGETAKTLLPVRVD